jgi:hypothetical protein
MPDALRQLHIADHLLSVTYPVVNDPKLLLSVAEHCRRAVEDVAETYVQQAIDRKEYEYPKKAIVDGKPDMLLAFLDLHTIRKLPVQHAPEAIAAAQRLRGILQKHKQAHNAFHREGKLVIANDEFSTIDHLSPEEMKSDIALCKRFIGSAQ